MKNIRSNKGLAGIAKKFSAFDLATCQTYGVTEMDKLFDYFDGL